MNKIFNLYGFLLCIISTLFNVSCIDEYPSSEKVTTMKMNVSTQSMVSSRTVINDSYFPEGTDVGVFVLDNNTLGTYEGSEYTNLKAQANGEGDAQEWALDETVYLNMVKARAVAYYPYSSTIQNYTAVPVEAGTTDYMYSGWVTDLDVANNTAQFTMKHAMFDMCWKFKRGNYDKAGVISSIKIKSTGLAQKASLDISTGTYSSAEGLDKFINIPFTATINEQGADVEWMAVPFKDSESIQMIVVVDGQEFEVNFKIPGGIYAGHKVSGTFIINNNQLILSNINILDWNCQNVDANQVEQFSRYLTVAYNVSSTTESTKLTTTDNSLIKEMWVDGVKKSPAASYTFSTSGEHIVKFLFKDNNNMSNFKDIKNLTKIMSWPSMLKSIPSQAFMNCTGLVQIERLPENIESIGENAFYACSSLDGHIYIPSKIAVIGKDVFYGCKKLSSITVDENNTVYDSRDNCNAIIETETGVMIAGCNNTIIPEGCTKINDRLFNGYTGFNKELVIPNTVSEIGGSAFQGCTGITGNLIIPESMRSIGNNAFYGCTGLNILVFQEGLTFIGDNAFSGCTGLTGKLLFPNSLENIGVNTSDSYHDGVFKGCSNITSVKFGSGLRTIAGQAFKDCKGIKSITFSEGIETIGPRAFEYCTEIEGKLIIPRTIQVIGNGAFKFCNKITDVEINAENCQIMDGVRYNYNAYTQMVGAFQGCVGITSVTLSGVNHIGSYAFEGCTGITSFSIDDKLVSIGSYAFANCTGLTGSFDIKDGVTRIGSNAFQNCTGLTEVQFGKDVTNIMDAAFSGCTNIEKLVVDNGNSVYDSRYNCNAVIKKTYDELVIGCKTTVIPDNVQIIGKGAFKDITDFSGILTLPSACFVVRQEAFRGCTGISGLQLNEGLVYIETGAFQECRGITGELVIPNSVLAVEGKFVFTAENYYSLTTGAFYGCTGITNIIFGTGMKEICESSFWGCSGLKVLDIPGNIKTVGWNAFRECRGLTEVIMQEGVEVVGAGTFQDCGNLTKVTMPSTMKTLQYKQDAYMYWGAFKNCSKLNNIICKGTVPPTTGPEIFTWLPEVGTLTVPAGYTSAYTSFKNSISYNWTIIEQDFE